MRRRALLVGSQTGSLRGVHADVELMHDLLSSFGFTTTRLIEGDATYQGIVDAYRGFADDTTGDDAVVFYYSGHGARYKNPAAARDASQPRWLQYLLPVDVDDRTGGAFRGVLAEELSQLQWLLTQRTPNVTTILDCCHSARMSRDPDLLPKTPSRLVAFPWPVVRARWEAVRSTADAQVVHGEVNPNAVQLVACAPDESAYELERDDVGGPHGVLTVTLARLLRQPGHERLTWRQLTGLLRPAVADLMVNQRPESAGPVDRYLFDTAARSATGVILVLVEGGSAVLEGAALFGIAEGDTYAIVAPDSDPAAPLAIGTVDRIVGGRAHLQLDHGSPAQLPAGSEAHPREAALGRRPVAVAPADHPDRRRVVKTLRHSPHVRLSGGGDQAMATVLLGDGDMQLLDPAGEPLLAAARPTTEAGVALLAADLQRLARATHIRELAPGTGPSRLDGRVRFDYTLLKDGSELPLERGTAHLFTGDQVVVRIRNQSGARRFVTVFDVGLSGAVTLLTTAQSTGALIDDGCEYELYRLPATNELAGVDLFWPDALPGRLARPETFLSLVMDRPEDLTPLIQGGVIARGAVRAGSPLRRLVEDLAVGVRDGRPPAEQFEVTRYQVERFDFYLHPEPRPAEEPPFRIDERPDLSFRLVVPRSGQPVRRRVGVRLCELLVHANEPLRLDALVVTPAADSAPVAWTYRLPSGANDDGIPAVGVAIFGGPVADFLDLAIWISPDSTGAPDLADLLVAAGDGVSPVRSLAERLLESGSAAGAVDTVARLTNAVARLLDEATGPAAGVYRTSLLPHERFGTGDPVRRYPPEGLFTGSDISFAYEVVNVE